MISLITRNSVTPSNLATGSCHCMIDEAMCACRHVVGSSWTRSTGCALKFERVQVKWLAAGTSGWLLVLSCMWSFLSLFPFFFCIIMWCVLKECSWDKHDETPNILISKQAKSKGLHSGFTPRSSEPNTHTNVGIVALSWLLVSHGNVGVSYSTVPIAASRTGSVIPMLNYLAISGVYANASSCIHVLNTIDRCPLHLGVYAHRDDALQLLPRCRCFMQQISKHFCQ